MLTGYFLTVADILWTQQVLRKQNEVLHLSLTLLPSHVIWELLALEPLVEVVLSEQTLEHVLAVTSCHLLFLRD